MHKIFGLKQEVNYTNRVGAYIIPVRDGKIGVVKTAKGYFLLGGGIDSDESHEECIKRECLEEVGYAVSVGSKICSAEMYCEHPSIGYFHPVQTYYMGDLLKQVSMPVEDDHEFMWVEYGKLRDNMYLEMQGWAVEQCMLDLELLKLSPGELTDRGICPTCFNRLHNGALYGDNTDKLLYEDEDIECFLIGNPRSDGHMAISTIQHYHDMSEAPDEINEKIVRFAKRFMNIIKEVYGCERVYMCTMCDGPNNHYHIQLIPRYDFEKRGSGNFVKPRKAYVYDEEKHSRMRALIQEQD